MNRVVVTGANRGIGLELCRQLQARGDRVTAVCRQSSAALDALDVRCVTAIDVATAEGAAALATALDGETIDVLVNNAGVLSRDTLDSLDYDAIAEQFRVNSMGPLRVTAALRGLFRKGSKVVIITSRMGSVADNSSGSYYGYRASKAAVNVIGKSLSVDLATEGVAVALLHPGMVATDMTGGQGIAVEESARGLIARMDELRLGATGKFWHAEGMELPW